LGLWFQPPSSLELGKFLVMSTDVKENLN
jgi:hypothetical protein